LSRMKIVDFSSVVFADSTGVLVKSGKELFTFDNMAGKNIGVIAGTTNERAVSDQLARRNLSATLVEFRDRREGIAALARGDLDGFASDKFVLLALARAENLRDFTMLPDDLSFEPFAIMLPRADWAFRLAVNTALAHVFRSGEILGLYTKYLGGRWPGHFQLGWRCVHVWWPARMTARRRGDRTAAMKRRDFITLIGGAGCGVRPDHPILAGRPPIPHMTSLRPTGGRLEELLSGSPG